MLTKEELNAIKERAEKATPRSALSWEWYVDEEHPDTVRNSWDCELIAQSIPTFADAEFIAHSREDIPNLLDHIAELEAEIERLDLFLQEIDTHIRSTPEPLPYIIETMRNYLDYREGLANE